MTTLTQLDPVREPQVLAELPQLPRDAGGPVFAEPWQAQAFALAVKLSEQGHFTWKEWAAALAAELKAAATPPTASLSSSAPPMLTRTINRLGQARGGLEFIKGKFPKPVEIFLLTNCCFSDSLNIRYNCR